MSKRTAGWCVALFCLATVGAWAQEAATAQREHDVQRVQADMRALATAIRAYEVDWNALPTPANPPVTQETQLPNSALPSALTTPMAYITSFPSDPFSRSSGSYAYVHLSPSDPLYQKMGRWMLLSPGPDGRWDIPHNPVPEADVANLLYDVTNGTESAGDVALGERAIGE
jgi:hypothetical protein